MDCLELQRKWFISASFARVCAVKQPSSQAAHGRTSEGTSHRFSTLCQRRSWLCRPFYNSLHKSSLPEASQILCSGLCLSSHASRPSRVRLRFVCEQLYRYSSEIRCAQRSSSYDLVRQCHKLRRGSSHYRMLLPIFRDKLEIHSRPFFPSRRNMHLVAVAGHIVLTVEQFETVLSQIESMYIEFTSLVPAMWNFQSWSNWCTHTRPFSCWLPSTPPSSSGNSLCAGFRAIGSSKSNSEVVLGSLEQELLSSTSVTS